MYTATAQPQVGAPGQTVYVHQPAQMNYATTVQNPNTANGKSERFNGAAGRATGWIQLCCGIGSVVLCIAEIVLTSIMGYVGYGIWASVLFYIPAGILGIFTLQKNSCVIVGYLTMSIIAAFFACGQLFAGISGAAISSSNYGCYDFGYSSDGYGCPPGVRDGRVAADSLLAILGLVEMIVAIVGAAYCCGGMSCCNTSSTRLQQTTVVTTGAPMVYTTGITTQPGVVQPPPYNMQQAYPPPGQVGVQQAYPPPGQVGIQQPYPPPAQVGGQYNQGYAVQAR